jgi:hypothetical protein
MNVQEKLATIQTKFKSKKSRYNSFGKYNFRSAEDILEAIKPYLLELGVTVTVNEELIGTEPYPIIKSTAVLIDWKTRETEQATAIVGVDETQKGMAMPQRFGSCSSYGKKYSLGNLFLIDDTADSDATNDHKGGKVEKKKPELKGEAAKKAAAAIKAGTFTLQQVKEKYEVSAAVLKTLS